MSNTNTTPEPSFWDEVVENFGKETVKSTFRALPEGLALGVAAFAFTAKGGAALFHATDFGKDARDQSIITTMKGEGLVKERSIQKAKAMRTALFD